MSEVVFYAKFNAEHDVRAIFSIAGFPRCFLGDHLYRNETI